MYMYSNNGQTILAKFPIFSGSATYTWINNSLRSVLAVSTKTGIRGVVFGPVCGGGDKQCHPGSAGDEGRQPSSD